VKGQTSTGAVSACTPVGSPLLTVKINLKILNINIKYSKKLIVFPLGTNENEGYTQNLEL
jgi:hypothetical protein